MSGSRQISELQDIKEVIAYVEDVIRGFLPDADKYPSKIAEAMNYAMTAGGKRIRPTLMLLTYAAIKQSDADGSSIDPFLAAIEMIHTHSLIHDDLPALDNDTLRRGRPTVHVEFDEPTAILAGDALLNYAYEVCARIDSFDEKNPDTMDIIRRYKAHRILLEKTGIDGMLGGQALDVQMSGLFISDEQRDYINMHKTCALIAASLMIGAVIAGASDEIVGEMQKAGNSIGLAFQVQDDVLDVIGEEEKLGKEIHQDERNSKNTYVARYGLDAAKEFVKAESEKAMSIIREVLPENNKRQILLDLIEMLISRDV